MKTPFLLLFALLLSGCSLTGQAATDPGEISLTVDAENEIHLSSAMAIPPPVHSQLADLDRQTAFDLASEKAQPSEHTLFLLYEEESGEIVQDVYDLKQPFTLAFAQSEWVRRMQNAGNGSLVVLVERFQDPSQLRYSKLRNFEISGCTRTECPECISAIGLLGQDTSVNFDSYYHARISRADPIQFLTGWCTNDPALLEQNLEQMEFVFNVKSHSYADYLRNQRWSQPGTDNSEETEYCYGVGVVVRNWNYGTYDIQFGYRIKAEIYDGWETYAPQAYIRYYSLEAR